MTPVQSCLMQSISTLVENHLFCRCYGQIIIIQLRWLARQQVPLNYEPWDHDPSHGMPPIRWAKHEPYHISQWESQLFYKPASTWLTDASGTTGALFILGIAVIEIWSRVCCNRFCLLLRIMDNKSALDLLFSDGVILDKEIPLKPVGPHASV